MHIYKDLKTISDVNKFVFKLEDADQNYEYYLELIKKFNLKPRLSKKRFLSIKLSIDIQKKDIHKSNKSNDWTEMEESQFIKHTRSFTEIYNKLKLELYPF